MLGLLAQGGMGAVYTAEQLSTGKQRALKVMHPSLVADSGLQERFVQEARVGSMIPSDHVVEVVAAGVDATTGQPWLVMELLSGEDLAEHVARRGPFALSELPSILRPIFHALAAAHARGIVHRDIKPENIFLASTMSSTQPITVKVLDFGIAKVAAQALGTATTAIGSPIWMAPEQTESRSHVSPATDVWSLGLLAFWMLTARPYWRAAQGGSSVAQLMREVLFEPIEPASRRAAEHGFAGALPSGFDTWFARCVARNPSERFADATQAGTELLQDVLGTTAGIPLGTAPRPSAPMPSVAPPPNGSLPMSGTSVPIVTAAAPVSRSSTGLGIAVLGGGAFIALGLIAAAVIVAVVAFFVLRPEPGPVPAQAPAPAPPTQAPLGEPVVKTPPSKPVVVAPKKAPYSAGQKVDVLWEGSWWQGQIVAVKGDSKFLIHYIGWASSYDEWVTTARLRPWTGSARTQ